MKICPKCKNKHQATGVYCTRKCANSRVFTKEAREKKSIANKKVWNNLTIDQKHLKLELLQSIGYNDEDYLQRLITQDWDVVGRHSKRLRVILEQNGKCNRCELTHWQGERITLEYEHKDGNDENNERVNVEALCPNCHSMTPTWRGRKNKGRQKRVEKFIEIKELL